MRPKPNFKVLFTVNERAICWTLLPTYVELVKSVAFLLYKNSFFVSGLKAQALGPPTKYYILLVFIKQKRPHVLIKKSHICR